MTPVINPFDIDVPDDPYQQKRIVGTMATELRRVIEEVVSASGGGMLTGNMKVVAQHSATAMLHIGGTLNDLKWLMMDGRNDALLRAVRQHGNPASREFFTDVFEGENFNSTRNGLYTRLELLLSLGYLRDVIVGKSTLNLRKAVDDRKVIVFSLHGMAQEEYSMFGRFLVAYLLGIALQRNPNDPNNVPIHLFIDECHNFLTESVRKILKETRKFGLHLTLAQQEVGDGMSDALKQSVLSNCNIILAGSNNPRSRNTIMRTTGAGEEDFSVLGQGKFLLHVDEKKQEQRPFPVQVRGDLRDNSNAMSGEEWEAVIARQIKRYYRPVEEVQRETRRRLEGSSEQEQGSKPRAPKFRFGN